MLLGGNRGEAGEPGARGRARLLRPALVGAVVLATFALAEGAARVKARMVGVPYSAEKTEREMKRVLAMMRASRQQGQSEDEQSKDDPSHGLVLHPYLGFDWPQYSEQIARDVGYFRGDDSPANYDIVVVGGSVAGSFGDNGAARLVEVLQDDPFFHDRRVRVLSHGRGGYKQPQQLMLVAYMFSIGYRPDLVLNLDGFNECALASANLEQGVHPAHPSASHWAHRVSSRRVDRTSLDLLLEMRSCERRAASLTDWVLPLRLHSSALLGELATMRLRALRKEYVALAQRSVKYLTDSPDVTVTGPPFLTEPEKAWELACGNWFESSRSLDALCRARSIRYLHVLQPTLHDPGSKPLAETEIANGKCAASWIEGVHRGYPRLRELGAELRESGIPFVDASYAFQDVAEPLYYDACHFNVRGNELLARRIADAILELERAAM